MEMSNTVFVHNKIDFFFFILPPVDNCSLIALSAIFLKL